MNNNIHPCLWYDGNAKAAADFYCSLFPHSKITVNSPMVVNFELNARPDDPVGRGQKFMGLNGGSHFKFNPSISFMVISESDNEINDLYQQLSKDGMVMMPLNKYDWSEQYAFVADRFGLAWQIMKTEYSNVNQKITPCFLFVGDSCGKAETAVKFYTGVFPHSSVGNMSFYKENEGPNKPGTVKHAQFILDDKVFMAMDGAGAHEFAFNEAISFVAECNNQKEIDFYWDTLTADGGRESRCGWLKDKWGISWQIIPRNLGQIMQHPEKGQRAMQALMQMNKIEIEKLMNA
jgi:predicted 3-demethylubiquinone-9 3-methyltransferase (glyoxalase superfamily)